MEIEKITKAKLFPADLREFVEQALKAQGYEVKGGLSVQVFSNFQLELELVEIPTRKDIEEKEPSAPYKELPPTMDKEERKRERQRVAYAKWRDKQNAKKQAERETKPPNEQALLAKRAPLAKSVTQREANELSQQIPADNQPFSNERIALDTEPIKLKDQLPAGLLARINKRGCEDCGITNPSRGFFPIFEDEDEVTHKVCRDCYEVRCREDDARQQAGRIAS